VWLIGAVVCLLSSNRGSSCLLTRAVDGHIVHTAVFVNSCQSAATFKIVKSASGLEFVSCKKHYGKYRTLPFTDCQHSVSHCLPAACKVLHCFVIAFSRIDA